MTVSDTTPPLVAVRGLVKRYGGITALDGMTLVAQRGTVHAVVGENGAGKSTLMKILAGTEHPDAGTIALDGQETVIDSPRAGRQRGIGIVYQELSLFPERSVLANLFVNREPTRAGLVSRRLMRERSRDLLDQLGLRVDVEAPVGRLAIGEQQLVELCRVLLEEPRLLILDEPNSALNQAETERLFAALHRLRAGGTTMLYVSHRLEEVFAIADRVTVARNGRDVFTRDRTDLTLAQVIEGMVGTQPDALFPARTTPRGSPTAGELGRELAVDRLAGGPLHEASFCARGGEILGLAGLEGSGVAVLLGLLFGTRTARAGSARFPDGRGLPKTPTEAARRRICMVPGDRRRHGLMLDRSVIFNISEVAIGSLRHVFRYDRSGARDRAERQIAALRIRTSSPYAVVGRLSGGNQQKVVIGKWLEIAPEVVLLDDPTRGVDVGAKREIYRLIRFMADEGRIVLFSSTELPELVGLCDRIVVLYRGRVAGEVAGGGADSRALLHLVNTGAPPPDPGNESGEQTVAH